MVHLRASAGFPMGLPPGDSATWAGSVEVSVSLIFLDIDSPPRVYLEGQAFWRYKESPFGHQGIPGVRCQKNREGGDIDLSGELDIGVRGGG